MADNSSLLKNGNKILIDQEPYLITDNSFVNPGKGQAFTKVKIKNLINGKILDVAVDIRKSSSTFGKHVAIELTSENKHQLFIPQGFAHGFVTLSSSAIFAYKVDNFYSPECDRGLAFDDVDLNIDWQLTKRTLRVSDKDAQQPRLTELTDYFDFNHNYYE